MERDERIAKLLNTLNEIYLEILNDVVGYPITRELVQYALECITHHNSRLTRIGWGDFCWESGIVEVDGKMRIVIDLILRDIDWMTTVWIDFNSETAQIEIKSAE